MKGIKYYFGVVLLSLVSCQKDNPVEELPVKEEAIVSAISLHEAQEKLSQERMNASLGMLPDWESFSMEEVIQGFEYSQVRTSIFNSEIEGEMVFFRVRDTLLSYLLMHQIDEEKPAIERYVFFTPDGFFVDGYVFEEGEMTHRMVPSRLAAYEVGRNCREIQKLARKNGDPDWKLRCYDLEEVVVVHNREKNANKCKNVTGKSGSCEAWLFSSDVSLLYDCLPDDIDCMDRKIKAEIEAARQDMAYHKKHIRGRSGGKGSGGNKHEERIDSIYHDFKNYRCAHQLVNELPRLNNRIANLVNKTFKTDGKLNIRFEAKKLNENIDGLNELVYRSKTGDTLNFKITLNESILKTSTKDYILVTMYHEALHAYLDTERERLKIKISENEYDYSEFEKKYPDVYVHNTQGIHKGKAYSKSQFLVNKDHFKFEPYINKLADAIISFNPQISRETALAMAKTGIIRPTELYDWEKELNESHRNGTASNGKKCENGKR